MTSREALERILMLARPCDYEVREHRNNYCDMLENVINQDLDRLEKLEKTIELLKARVKMLETYHEPRSRYYHLFIGGRVVLLSREEYELLKEVLEDAL